VSGEAWVGGRKASEEEREMETRQHAGETEAIAALQKARAGTRVPSERKKEKKESVSPKGGLRDLDGAKK